MTVHPNPVFKKHYADYLRQLGEIDFSSRAPVLDIAVDVRRKAAQVPFFRTRYQVSPSGVENERGERPDYGTCVILLKYLLMCPSWLPSGKDWITYRDFPDSGQAQNTGLADHAKAAISKRYARSLDRLESAVHALGGRPPETDYPYDISTVIQALPRIPILLLFNAADEQFAAQASILYERRAVHFLDAECRVMVDWYLFEHLKRAERR